MFTANADHVFIERDETETTFAGMEVSQKALTKNLKGTIKAIGSYKNVSIGDEVLIPHYGVQDVEVDGKEYALTKHSKLFAKKESGTYRPINQYVKIRKCVNDHVRDEDGEIALFLTERGIEKTNFVEIIDVADDCDRMKTDYIGMFVHAPEEDNRLARIEHTKDFCLHEDLIEFVINTGD